MDEAELQEVLMRNPDLRRRNANNVGIEGNVGNTNIARNTVIPSDEEMRAEADAMLESKLQSELRRIALANGYLYYHTHDSRRSDSGFPDTVLLRVNLRSAELYFVELKRQSEEPDDEQQRWIEALKALRKRADHFLHLMITVNIFVWKPMELLDGTIEGTLAAPSPERELAVSEPGKYIAPHDRSVFYLNDEEATVILRMRKAVQEQRKINRQRSMGEVEEQ